MKNEKKNPFLCNVGLFSLSYFTHRVMNEKDFQDHTSSEVISTYEALRTEWIKNESLLTHKKINESDTEKLFVDTVVKTLGYSYLTKSALSSGEKGKKKYPDYALFPNASIVSQALDSDDEFKFSKSLGVIEGKKFGLTLNDIDENDDDDRLPAVQLIDYLQKTGLDWGFLTNGKQWQVYCRRGQYNVSKFFEIELTDLLSHPKPTHEFAVFIYLFGIDALRPGKDGKNRLDRLSEISKKYAQDVGIPFFEGCEYALRKIFEFYQGELKASKNQGESKKCHQASLILLFRLIAIRYLEDRGVLPVLDGKYRHLSLDRLRVEIEKTLRSGGKYLKTKSDIWNKIRILFKDVNSGSFGIYLGHRGFESDLFDIDFDAFFRDHPIPDNTLVEIVDAICRGKGKSASQIDFYDLGVEKIGDVYNQLLALRIVEDEKTSRWNLTYSEAIKKDLGSYFTHPSLTGLLSESVQKYLHEHYPQKTDWLKLKICDNSCGSGHFLRQMIEDLSYLLYISSSNTSRKEADKVVDQNSFRRMLAQHCIFGIDRDVNAVWLTKLSLWLHTAEKGKPFVFLDHHVVQGDSILSTVEIPQLEEQESREIGRAISALSQQHSEDKAAVVSSASAWLKLKTLTKKYAKLQNPQMSFFETAKDIKETYFSYAQAFPEVFLNPTDSLRGFSIIVGNPPWDTVKPKLPDFYKMETGADKAPARKELDKWVNATTSRTKKFGSYRDTAIKYASAIKSAGYNLQAGEVYTYAYFTERSLQTLAVNGLLCYIVKLGLYGDEKVKKLRRHLFVDNVMENMWVIKKNKTPTGKFFAQIDPNEKFIVFVNRKSGLRRPNETPSYIVPAKEVKTFEDVSHEFQEWQKYSLPQSLDSLSKVTVFDSMERKSISDKINYRTTLRSAELEVGRELDITLDRKAFTDKATDIPIYSGTEIGHFRTSKPIQWCKDSRKPGEYSTFPMSRLAINDILPNSRRKIRCSGVPKGSLCDNSLLIIYGFKTELDKKLVMGSLNSLLVDFYLRPSLSNIHLNNFRLYDLPVALDLPVLAKQELGLQVSILEKLKIFNESHDSFKRIEGLLAAGYGLSDQEIRFYIESFGPTDIVNDVIDYAGMFREEYGFGVNTSETTKPRSRKKAK